MQNIIGEKPDDELHGRALYNTIFVDDSDIKNRNILDIGCGYGWLELNAAKRNCHRITGIELTKGGLDTAKKYITDDKIGFEVGSAIDLPFGDSQFDTVVSWEVIEHIPKNTESKMFSEAYRVLKNDGVFYLSTPYNNFFSKIFDPAWWLVGHRHYKENILAMLAENNGFKLEKKIINGGFWEILGINNLYIAKWIFKRKIFFEKFIHIKQDDEFKKERGIANIFIKFRKI